mgnify:CR=1 FL=1
MRLQELPQYVAIDIKEALEERFMDSEAMYVRFLRKLLTTDDYKLMEEAAEAGNWQEVLRYAHNLKGVCATLGLTGCRRSLPLLLACCVVRITPCRSCRKSWRR